MAIVPSVPQAAHHICAWLTLERFLIEAHIQQAAQLRAGSFTPLAYITALRQLAMLIPLYVCTKRRSPATDDIPPLLPLLNQLPAHMQMQLEQAIEAELRGEATHEVCEVTRAHIFEQVVEYAMRKEQSTEGGGPPQPLR